MVLQLDAAAALIGRCYDDVQVIPWNTLKYLIGEVMYGGRVIDDFDRRIVNTYMDEYMGDFLFDTFQPFHFYADDTVDYYIPEDGPKETYQAMAASSLLSF